jgi:DNA-binding transcriptional MocR family regulator
MIDRQPIQQEIENKTKKRSLRTFIEQVQTNTFSSPGHEVSAKKDFQNARVTEINNKIGNFRHLLQTGQLEGTPAEWKELKKNYLQIYAESEVKITEIIQEAFDLMDKAFSDPEVQ